VRSHLALRDFESVRCDIEPPSSTQHRGPVRPRPKPDISILSEAFLAEVRGMPQRNLAVQQVTGSNPFVGSISSSS